MILKKLKTSCLVLLLSQHTFALAGTNQTQQWPMFGGENGNNQISTQSKVPTEWSARTGKNIKWRTELPAGGQSGITVWENKVFLTINNPLNTPKFVVLDKEQKLAKSNYETLYKKIYQSLIDNKDLNLQLLTEKLAVAEKTWQAFLKQRAIKKQPKLNYNGQMKTKQWKALAQSKKNKLNYVLAQNKQLKQNFERLTQAEAALNNKGVGKDIDLYCLDINTGKVLWQKPIIGTKMAMYNYTFSDATSPSPATDGHYVWVVNAAGGMAAFTMNGKEVWSRMFSPTKDAPFNKQYDTIIYKNMIFNVEPKAEGDNKRVDNWNYLHAFDKYTGKRLWVSVDGLTHYSTPVFSYTKEGVPAIMIGRGGPHEVPEKPEGLSLVDLREQTAGASLWQWQAPTKGSKAFGGTEIQLWDKKHAYWLQGNNFKQFEIFQIDSSTGKLKTKHNLFDIKRYAYDENAQHYTLEQNPKVQGHIDRQPYTQVVVNNKLYYMVRYQPYIAYHDLKTGENIHLEVPTELVRKKGQADQYIWHTMQTTDQLNAKGQRHNTESRAQGDGTQKAFLGTPIVVNQYIYFTNAHGITYVIDTSKPFGPDSLVAVNDLGAKGQTVSLNTMAYSNGTLFHRSLKEIIAIESN